MEAGIGAFSRIARALSGSPLQIIALFLVLIYGFACLVIGLGSAKIQELGHHPLIYFLALFPCLVLGAFAWLVAKHHWKLYGLTEFADQKDFLQLANPPKGLPRSRTGLALTDASQEITLSDDLQQRIDKQYEKLIREGFFLLHAAEVLRPESIPGSGLFRVRVWLEVELEHRFSEIEAVTYRVWHDFPQRQIATQDRTSQFAVWLNVYGEFPVLAHVKLKAGREIWLSRYLELPSRPKG